MVSRRRLPILLALLIGAAANVWAQDQDALVGTRSLALSPDGSKLAFSYQGDIWVVDAEGGRAIPITSHVEMDDNPIWSPDGNTIAFSSTRYGNNEIYITGVDGGRPKRLTWHSGSDVPSGWTPDGKRIVFRATRDAGFNGIYSLDTETGRFRPLLLDMMTIGTPRFSPDGSKILYSRFGFPWSRPRYHGSAAAQPWILDLKTGERKRVRNNEFQHLWMHWTPQGRIMAVTQTEIAPSSSYLGRPIPRVEFTFPRTPNVYEFGVDGRGTARTRFTGDGARFLTVASQSGAFAFERDGTVFVAKGGEPKAIRITANVDDKLPQEERLILTDGATAMDLSPDGGTVFFAARGDIWSVPVKKGTGPNKDDATRWTDWAGSDEQAIHTPDGKAVFFVSDREGAERLYRMELASRKVVAITDQDADVGEIRRVPGGKLISFWMTGKQGGLYTVPVEGGAPNRIFARPGANTFDHDWSPDGKWVAYEEALLGSGYYYWESAVNIHVVNAGTGESKNVTQLSARHFRPRWTPDGRYLFFGSDREGSGIFVLPLKPEEQRGPEITLKFEKPKETPNVEIDFDGIETRVRRLIGQPLQGNLQIDREDGGIYFQSEGDVWRANYNGEEARRLTTGGGVERFGYSADGKFLEVSRTGGNMVLIEPRRQNSPATPISFRAEWTRDIKAERHAAYNEFWRMYNRGFYDPNFHGRDWLALRGKYEKFLGSVGHRNEMATVLNMLVGELETSHAEVSPAPVPQPSATSAHLGFTFDYSYDGPGIKVLEVPNRTPGSFSRSRLNPGDIVMKVNGRDVRPNEGLYRDVLNDESGRDLVLQVRAPDSAVREVRFRAISGAEFSGILFANRVEARRKHVEQRSQGRLTYVHIAGMGPGELTRFNQQVWMFARDKKGLIIDVRNNGGGNTSDRIIDILERRQNAWYQPRDEQQLQGPGQTLGLPMVVMHAETSFSNAEMFPYAMRVRGLARLVGMPTPGYVIYTGGFRLVDGTICRMPGTGVFRLDGSPMENMGVLPDIEVDITPEQFFRGEDPQLDKAIEVLLRG